MKRGSAGSIYVHFKCDGKEQAVPKDAYVNGLETGDPRILWRLPNESEDE